MRSIFIFLFIMISSLLNAFPRYTLQQFALIGKVKSVMDIVYKASEIDGVMTKGIIWEEQVENLELFIRGSHVYSFSEDGFLKQDRILYREKSTFVIYTYNSNKQLLEIEDKTGVDWYFDYSNPTKIKSSSSQDQSHDCKMYEFDSSGRCIKTITFLGKGFEKPHKEMCYVYDVNNRLVSCYEVFVADNVFAGGYTFDYDKKGNLIQLTYAKIKGETKWTRTFSYELDATGNWTKRIIKENGIIKHIEERTIEYYE